MNQRYSQVKQKLDILIEKAVQQAMEEGVDISSPKFQKVLDKLKSRILKAEGLTVLEYEKTGTLKKKNYDNLLEAASEKIKKKEKESDKKVNDLMGKFSNDIETLKEQTEKKINKEKESLQSEISELKSLISELKGTIKKKNPRISRNKEQLKNINQELYSQVSRLEDEQKSDKQDILSEIKSIKGDLIKNISNLKEKTEEREFSQDEKESLKQLMKRDWFEEIQAQIKDLTPRLWRGMGAGLKKKIEKETVENRLVDNEVPSGTVDGSNKTFTLASTPVSGSEKLFMNGQRLSSVEDYSISDKTITFSIAPPSGSNLLADYKKQL